MGTDVGVVVIDVVESVDFEAMSKVIEELCKLFKLHIDIDEFNKICRDITKKKEKNDERYELHPSNVYVMNI